MTIKRLVCACYNFYPSKSKVVVIKAIGGKELYRGLSTDRFLEEFGDLKVIDFGINRIDEPEPGSVKNGVIDTLTIIATKEYAK